MQNWHDNILRLIAEIDRCIRAREGETLTLTHLARLLDCSQSQVSHKFHALTGTSLREFLQARRPALALPAVRDGEQRPYLQLGHSSGGMLGCAPAARFHRRSARSAAADGGPRRGLSGFRARSV